jgi:hypothetical protein
MSCHWLQRHGPASAKKTRERAFLDGSTSTIACQRLIEQAGIIERRLFQRRPGGRRLISAASRAWKARS